METTNNSNSDPVEIGTETSNKQATTLENVTD